MTEPKEDSKPKLTKVTAVLDYELSKKETGTLRLWGIDFICKDGKATASIDTEIAKAMKSAKRVK